MITKVIGIAVAAIVIVALMFMADKLLPRKEDNDSNDKSDK
jgi:hypothetical protein